MVKNIKGILFCRVSFYSIKVYRADYLIVQNPWKLPFAVITMAPTFEIYSIYWVLINNRRY